MDKAYEAVLGSASAPAASDAAAAAKGSPAAAQQALDSAAHINSNTDKSYGKPVEGYNFDDAVQKYNKKFNFFFYKKKKQYIIFFIKKLL